MLEFGLAALKRPATLNGIGVGLGAYEIVELAYFLSTLVDFVQTGLAKRGEDSARKGEIVYRVQENIDDLARQIAWIAWPDHRNEQIGIIAHSISRQGRAEIIVAKWNASTSRDIKNAKNAKRGIDDKTRQRVAGAIDFPLQDVIGQNRRRFEIGQKIVYARSTRFGYDIDIGALDRIDNIMMQRDVAAEAAPVGLFQRVSQPIGRNGDHGRFRNRDDVFLDLFHR